MPKYFIVEQLVKVGRGEASELVPMPIKTIGNAPNENGTVNEDGEMPDFIRIPPIIRVYIGADTWGSPSVMPTHEEMEGMKTKPVVHTITLNPRTGTFNWHAGLGKGSRLDVDPYSGEKRTETLKPVSGTASTMPDKLGTMIGEIMAAEIVAMMRAEMISLNGRIESARAKRETKAQDKPRAPRKPKRKATKAELAMAEQDARLLQWAASRKAG